MLIIDTANTRKMLAFCSILPLAPFLPFVSRWASSHLCCSFYGFYLNNKQGYGVRHENMASTFYCRTGALKCVWVKNTTPDQCPVCFKKMDIIQCDLFWCLSCLYLYWNIFFFSHEDSYWMLAFLFTPTPSPYLSLLLSI